MVVPACVNQKYLHTIIRQGRRLKFLYMAICDICIHKRKVFDESLVWVWRCKAYRSFIIPECLSRWDVMEAVRNGKCEFFNKPIRFDVNGFAYVCAEEEPPQQQIDEDDDFPVVCD